MKYTTEKVLRQRPSLPADPFQDRIGRLTPEDSYDRLRPRGNMQSESTVSLTGILESVKGVNLLKKHSEIPDSKQ